MPVWGESNVTSEQCPYFICRYGAQVSLLARHTGQDQETIAKDIQRPKYFDPYQAKEYGIIDRVRISRRTL